MCYDAICNASMLLQPCPCFYNATRKHVWDARHGLTELKVAGIAAIPRRPCNRARANRPRLQHRPVDGKKTGKRARWDCFAIRRPSSMYNAQWFGPPLLSPIIAGEPAKGPPTEGDGGQQIYASTGQRLLPTITFMATTSSADRQRITRRIKESVDRPKRLPTPAAALATTTLTGLNPQAFTAPSLAARQLLRSNEFVSGGEHRN